MPYQSNEGGEFVSHTLHELHKRNFRSDGAWYFKMDAFGNKLHLKLRRNTQLVKPGLVLETMHKNGHVTKTSVKTDSYWLGEETSDPGSFAALSIDNGMVSVLICSCTKI